jgi:hypothetical protein
MRCARVFRSLVREVISILPCEELDWASAYGLAPPCHYCVCLDDTHDITPG